MVLDNASTGGGSAPDTYSDAAPASDGDVYNNPGLSTLNYKIDYNTLPKPAPILGSLMGYGQPLVTKVVQAKIKASLEMLERPPTLDEVNAMAYWSAKQVAIMSYASPVGVSCGAWRWYATMDSMTFPFFDKWVKTSKNFQPDAFPNAAMPVLRGNRAIVAWHAIRFLGYGTLGHVLSNLLFGSYAISTATVGETRDPRLKDYTKALAEKVRQQRGGLGNPAHGRRDQPGPRRNEGARVESTREQDDASPTGGMFFDEVSESGKTLGTDAGAGYTQPSPPQTQRQPFQRPQRSQSPPPRQTQPEELPFDPFGDSTPQDEQPIPQPQRPSGSAWDRIRNSQTSGSRPSNQIRGRRESEPEESFDSVRSKEERIYSKEQAQKAFDAQVERERRGGDFSGGNGDQKRW